MGSPILVKDLRDPTVSIVTLLAAQWAAANTPTVGTPRISTGWWDASHVLPQVTVDQSLLPPELGQSGYSGIGGSGPVTRIKGSTPVRVWAARESQSDPNPRKAVWEMRREVLRIVNSNVSGYQDLENLGVENALGDPDVTPDDAGRSVFRVTLDVTYTILIRAA